ncbi:biotin/lipoyl attachment domain-containing protein (plasmid) [Peptoclostridium acidaminophilum DSM 3953]|uniref:Biotin/lipoyl attachment domain-containing protein n=1 Tax=Peptoclostridium acidaminophilum DSM 3953 TaxID=1286171 RepID=W8TBJ3_PEPAC|nr:biotin/lipoyl-containing protein [Peptoclostridium acidaminophilum]AHM58195.1 biotin/lipoyl attachment domain-containing protein [Peptoclostridium acidaminophilum DSM 3953]
MKKYMININGKAYEVEVEEMGETAQTAPKPAATLEKAAQKEKSAPKQSNSGASESISAPMPGTIIDIKVREGDVVKSGQVIMVLEAMKMENEIVAPKDGKIMAIRASRGSSVASGEELLHIA